MLDAAVPRAKDTAARPKFLGCRGDGRSATPQRRLSEATAPGVLLTSAARARRQRWSTPPPRLRGIPRRPRRRRDGRRRRRAVRTSDSAALTRTGGRGGDVCATPVDDRTVPWALSVPWTAKVPRDALQRLFVGEFPQEMKGEPILKVGRSPALPRHGRCGWPQKFLTEVSQATQFPSRDDTVTSKKIIMKKVKEIQLVYQLMFHLPDHEDDTIVTRVWGPINQREMGNGNLRRTYEWSLQVPLCQPVTRERQHAL